MMAFFTKKKETPLEFPSFIHVLDEEYRIIIEFVKKKSSSVNVKENILLFRLSSIMSNKEKEEHFNSLLKKIILKIQKSPKIYDSYKFSEVMERGEFIFSNEKYLISYSQNKGIKLKENIFHINPSLNPLVIEKYFIKLLCKKYLERITSYVNTLNEHSYNLPVKLVQLKLVSSKWGHCTRDNNIMLNLKLLNAQTEILNYVIYHELAHIKVKNHSDKFWKEVERFCPNYKVLRKKLKENPPKLFVLE